VKRRLWMPILCGVALSFLKYANVSLDDFRQGGTRINATTDIVISKTSKKLKSLVEYNAGATKERSLLDDPKKDPTATPTVTPTRIPTGTPTKSPTSSPTEDPTRGPTVSPSGTPTGTPTGIPTGYNALHSLDKDILDLVDWEEQSLASILDPNATSQTAWESCNPPDGVSRTCCLGTFSNGGGLNALRRTACTASFGNQAFENLKKHTRRFFEKNALPKSNSSMACDACRIVDLARKHNLTIALMGDSMHNQIVDGLSCELQRRNYKVTMETVDLNPQKDPSWPYRRHTITMLFRIHSPSWAEDETVTIEFHRMYLLPLVTDDVAKVTANVDVLVRFIH
jgi:hypothetical protein